MIRRRPLSLYVVSLLVTACTRTHPGNLLTVSAADAPAAPVAVSGSTAPVATQAPATAAPAQAAGKPGVAGLATVGKAALAGAQISVLEAGNKTPLATATASASGSYSVPLPDTALGKLVRVVASSNGTTLVGAGIVAQGAGNLISQDAGTIISQDGGSLISQDGGSLISQDAGTFRLLDTTAAVDGRVNLDEGSTLATLALSTYLDAAGSLKLGDADAKAIVAALGSARTAASSAVGKLSSDQVKQLVTTASADGHGTVASALANAVTSSADFKASFTTVAGQLNDVIKQDLAAGQTLPAGVVPAGTPSFGTASGPAISTGSVGSSHGSGGGGAPDPTPTPVSIAKAPDATVLSSFQLGGSATVGSIAVTTAGDSVWVTLSHAGTYSLERLQTDGGVFTSYTMPIATTRLAVPIAAGNDVWLADDADNAYGLSSSGTLFVPGDKVLPGEDLQVVPDGSVWVIDGANHKAKHVVNLSSNLVSTVMSSATAHLAAAPNGGAWAVTEAGALLWAGPSSADFTSTTSFWTGATPTRLSASGDNSVWLAAGSELGHVRTDGSLIARVPLNALKVHALAAASDGSVWVDVADGSVEALVHFASTGAVLSSTAVTTSVITGQRLVAQPDGRGAWLLGLNGTHAGAYYADDQHDARLFLLPTTGTFAVSPADGSVWAADGTTGAVYHLAS